MRHLDEGTIHSWLDGALSEEKAHAAEEHAARCTQCAMAVADARGFIAASSRILRALDDVPRGVVPRGAGSALGARRSATADGSANGSARGIQPWIIKVAASVLIVGTTAVLITRSGARPTGLARVAESKLDSAVPVNGAPASPAATGGAAPSAAGAVRPEQLATNTSTSTNTNTPASMADKKNTDALLKSKAGESTTVAASFAAPSEPAAQAPAPAAAPAARLFAVAPAPDTSRLDSASAAGLRDQVATVPPKIAVAQPGAASREPAGAAKRSIGGEDATLPPGMRMVSEKTLTAQARVVQKRVYEVSPGVEVTYSIFGPVPERDRAKESAAPATDSGAADKDEAADADAGVNTIKWSDSTGTDFMLSGRLPLDSLRVIRSKLTTVHRQ